MIFFNTTIFFFHSSNRTKGFSFRICHFSEKTRSKKREDRKSYQNSKTDKKEKLKV